ncbi:MAG: DUF1749 domain-containing protein [Nanoarchaeota archaeon]|nr:DUF1749 domain-containing protein [Nanoarchaeota archaeon]
MKRVIIVHGWGGFPKNHWFPWLKMKLEEIGLEVIIPKMPDSEKPTIQKWVSHLKKVVGKVDKNTFFVGHSIGCQTIMRYLETMEDKNKVGGIIFVAGFFNLPFLQTNAEKKIAKPWLETAINTNKIRTQTKKIVAFFSDDDPDVSMDDAKSFKTRLNAKIIVEKNKGHFTLKKGVDKLPSVLNSLKEMTA